MSSAEQTSCDESVLVRRKKAREKYAENRDRNRARARERYAQNNEENRKKNRERYHRNREVYVASNRRWREQNYERSIYLSRRRDLKRFYGLTIDDYDRMLAEQHGRCAICDIEANDSPKGRLQVDHCHTTGKVRGLLCFLCNSAVGKLRDDSGLMEAAAAYVKRGGHG